MMPTHAVVSAEDDPVVLDEPIPEVEAELDTVRENGPGDFLRSVRSMLHGDVDDGRDEPAVDVEDAPEVAAVEEDLGDWLPGVWVSARPPTRRKGRTERRAERRRKAAQAIAATVPVVGPEAAPALAPRAPWLRRAAKLGLLAVLLTGAAALPWAAPAVPQVFADLVPGGTSVTKVADPSVSPPTESFTGPVGISRQSAPYAGVRLQAAGPPREVRVPRLHVDSDVVPISGQSGELLPPSDPQLLGWWQEGKPVGAQYGTAVVTGHTVHTGGGALDHLDKLVVGDAVRVRTDNGWIQYVVQQTRIYSTDQLARDAEKIFRLGGTGRLVLITCDNWNGSFYESNAVVVATPVSDEPTVVRGVTEVPDGGPGDWMLDPSGNMERRRGVDLREPPS